MALGTSQRSALLALARRSIECALESGMLPPFPEDAWLRESSEPHASFVTLRHGAELRGCCGTLDAQQPLSADVWHNAWAAGFADPRFTPLQAEEWPDVNVHISVLSRPESLPVTNEAELLEALQPRVDGLILQLGTSRVTFLPAVWEQLPGRVQFVRQLKWKAGWRADFWSPQLRAFRYTTESFGEHQYAAGRALRRL